MLGHSFQSMVINIPTACEICSSFMWLMERGYVCQNCKLTCHKKCQCKVGPDARFPASFFLLLHIHIHSPLFGSDLVALLYLTYRFPRPTLMFHDSRYPHVMYRCMPSPAF